jgi:hypothetical protein
MAAGTRVLGYVLRWLLVPVAAAGVVAAVIAGARWAVSLADRRCPVSSMVGGACVEPWHTSAVEAAIYAAVGLATLGIVVLPALIAPQLKRSVAVVGFAAVLAMAAAVRFRFGWSGLLIPSLIALACGTVALIWTWRHSHAS